MESLSWSRWTGWTRTFGCSSCRRLICSYNVMHMLTLIMGVLIMLIAVMHPKLITMTRWPLKTARTSNTLEKHAPSHTIQVFNMQVCNYESMQVWKYAIVQLCKFASVQVCKDATVQLSSMQVCSMQVCSIQVCSMQVCKYASMQYASMQSIPYHTILNQTKPNRTVSCTKIKVAHALLSSAHTS